MSGGGSPRTCSVLLSHSGWSRSSNSSPESYLPRTDSLGGDETRLGGLQPPCMDVHSASIPPNHDSSPATLLSVLNLGNSPLQPLESDPNARIRSFSPILLSPSLSGCSFSTLAESSGRVGGSFGISLDGGEYEHEYPKPCSIILTGTTSTPLPSPHSRCRSKVRTNSQCSGGRRNLGINEGNQNGNMDFKGGKSNVIQGTIRKKCILICPPNLRKVSIDIRAPHSQGI